MDLKGIMLHDKNSISKDYSQNEKTVESENSLVVTRRQGGMKREWVSIQRGGNESPSMMRAQ